MNNNKPLTLYMQNRCNSSKYKGYSSLECLFYLEGEELRNRLLFIYSLLAVIRKELAKFKI